MTLIIDSTGTMLLASSCYRVPDEAFTEDEFEHQGRFWQFRRLKLVPKPLQKPRRGSCCGTFLAC